MLDINKVSLTISQDGQKKGVLNKVSLLIKKGEFVAITGPNGSGKSSLAKIIMGLLQPTSGKISWDGSELTKLATDERARKGLAFSFQQPVRFKGITVYNILKIAKGGPISPDSAGAYLKQVGLEPSEYLNREIDGRLSGGELKRIELAGVLARNAEVLIFDEPEAGIDLWSFDDLVKVFQNLKKLGKTIIVISHQERILKIADKIVILENGKVKDFSEAKQLLPKILGGKHEN